MPTLKTYSGVEFKISSQDAITVKRKKIHLGVFQDIKDAIEARVNAESVYLKDFSYEVER